MREEFDFLAVPWSNWKTNGLTAAIKYAVSVCGRKDILFPPFSFEMQTEYADGTALRLHELYEAGIAFRMNNGPLGGGMYLVNEGKWGTDQGEWSMINTENGQGSSPPPVIGKPARFTFLLTGPPDVAEMFPGGGKA